MLKIVTVIVIDKTLCAIIFMIQTKLGEFRYGSDNCQLIHT